MVKQWLFPHQPQSLTADHDQRTYYTAPADSPTPANGKTKAVSMAIAIMVIVFVFVNPDFVSKSSLLQTVGKASSTWVASSGTTRFRNARVAHSRSMLGSAPSIPLNDRKRLPKVTNFEAAAVDQDVKISHPVMVGAGTVGFSNSPNEEPIPEQHNPSLWSFMGLCGTLGTFLASLYTYSKRSKLAGKRTLVHPSKPKDEESGFGLSPVRYADHGKVPVLMAMLSVGGEEIYDAPDKLSIEGGVEAMMDTCKRRFFFGPSFEIYNGVAGLYDYGPVMTAIKANFLQLWRQFFIIEEGMVELELTALTPEEVFIASGHAERFNDIMTKDVVNGECFRLDKYLEEYCDNRLNDRKDQMDAETRAHLVKVMHAFDAMNEEEMDAFVKQYDVKSPKGNDLAYPFEFNLMFATQIGPDGKSKGYLRPELAQGIFVNFKRMLDFNNLKMPFAGAATGVAYRNEIAPRGGLFRLREFPLAEIEHFVDPSKKDHPKFDNIKDLRIPLYNRESQEEGTKPVWMSIDTAVESGIIDNQTLAYFMGRVYLFLKALGICHIRFRQHRSNEMAHYAADCWDAELLTNGGWLECVGIADRSCYDLEVHSKNGNTEMTVFEKFPEPIEKEVVERYPNNAAIGKAFKKDSKKVVTNLMDDMMIRDVEQLEEELALAGKATIDVQGMGPVVIERDMFKAEMVKKKISGRNYTPSVIEPSFGIGRILMSMLEQTYFIRDDEGTEKGDAKEKGPRTAQRAGFFMPPRIAPYKVMICPLVNKDGLVEIVQELSARFAEAGIASRVDDTRVAIGKRYARTDELGVPFTITVDYGAIEDGTVTIRERDTCTQVRIPREEVLDTIVELAAERLSWPDVQAKYPAQESEAASRVGREA